MLNIYMAGIDFNKAALEVRERFALTKSGTAEMLRRIRHMSGASGCVIVGTCNRMELWISYEGAPEKLPFEILCGLFRVEEREYEQYFTRRDRARALQHLFELACGLKSLIFGEEQVLTQVKESIAFARECKASDPVLEAAFRSAVTAAKKAKTTVRLTAVDRSAANTVIETLRERYEDLRGLPCLVIGSGEMGRLSAERLAAEGCDVHLTLRRYHSGEAVLPVGCRAVDYEERHSLLKSAKVVVSATRSPHFTLLRGQVEDLVGTDEKLFFDLAVPRDIDPEIALLPNIKLFDIDHLGGSLAASEDNESVRRVKAIIAGEIREFKRWICARKLMPRINKLGAAASADAVARLDSGIKHLALDDSCRKLVHEAAGKAVTKGVEKILLSLQKKTRAEEFDNLLSGLDGVRPEDEETEESPGLPLRFPLFVDLSGKNIAVVGAGPVAMRRIRSLLSYPCNIAVTAPDVLYEIERMQLDGVITLKKKEYQR
jgi:glutamyl-tRNA reductase